MTFDKSKNWECNRQGENNEYRCWAEPIEEEPGWALFEESVGNPPDHLSDLYVADGYTEDQIDSILRLRAKGESLQHRAAL